MRKLRFIAVLAVVAAFFALPGARAADLDDDTFTIYFTGLDQDTQLDCYYHSTDHGGDYYAGNISDNGTDYQLIGLDIDAAENVDDDGYMWVAISIEGGRYLLSSVSDGIGDLSGVTLYGTVIGNYQLATKSGHIDADRRTDDDSIKINYIKRYKHTQRYSGITRANTESDWITSGSSVTLTATPYVDSGVTNVCVGWVTGTSPIPTSGDTNTVTFNMTADCELTWTYKDAHNLRIGVLPTSQNSAASVLPFRGSALTVVPDTGQIEASALEIITSGDDRYFCVGYTNGTGAVSPGSDVGTRSGGRVRVPFTFNGASALDFQYDLQRQLSVSVVPNPSSAEVPTLAVAYPTNGLNWIRSGTVVTARVNDVVIDSQNNRWVAQGWTGTGSVGSGSGNETVFTLNTKSTIQWNYLRSQTYFVGFDGLPEHLRGDAGIQPSNGVNYVFLNASTNLRAPAIIYDGNTRYVCEGWTGTDDVPVAGDTVQTPDIIVTKNSSITWKYRKEHRLLIGTIPPERQSAADPIPAGTNWYTEGTVVTASVLQTATDAGTNYVCLGGQPSGAAASSTESLIGSRLVRSFAMSEPAEIQWLFQETQIWVVGEPIPPPDGAASNTPPSVVMAVPVNAEDTAANSFFFGGPATDKKLYAVRPVTSVIVYWQPLVGTATIPVGGLVMWPAASNRQTSVGSIPVSLVAAGSSSYTFVQIAYSTTDATASNKQFFATQSGMSVIHFARAQIPDPVNYPSKFVVVGTALWNDPSYLTETNWTIGTAITNEFHRAFSNRNGHVFFKNSFYDADAFNREARVGPILPVNEDTIADADDMVVVWYEPGDADLGLFWPTRPYRYRCEWPADGVVSNIYVASGNGSGPLAPTVYPQAQVYVQDDPSKPGYNPNEEHAALYPLGGGPGVIALRNDLNGFLGASKPYVLVKYMDQTKAQWAMKVFKVVGAGSEDWNDFRYDVTAGTPILPVFPLSVLPIQQESHMTNGVKWYHRDHKGGHWAKGASSDTNNPALITMKWYYPLQQGWYYPDFNNDGSPDALEGAPVPLLNGGADHGMTSPTSVVYVVHWPTNEVGVLAVGETLTEAKHGLPDVFSMAAAEVIFDEGLISGAGPLVKLLDPISERWVPLNAVPADILTETSGARQRFKDIPYYLKSRLTYDPLNKRLYFGGLLDASGAGEPLLLLNVMSLNEKNLLQSLSPDWAATIGLLFDVSRNPNAVSFGSGTVVNPLNASLSYTGEEWVDLYGLQLGVTQDVNGVVGMQRVIGLPKALTAGGAKGTGWVTVVENDDPILGAAPVALHVMRVDGEPYIGEIKVIESDNLFDEKLTLRHSGDFGGEPERFTFEWYYKPDSTGFPPDLPPNTAPGIPLPPGWIFFARGEGLQEITIEGATPLTISDNWFAMRYAYDGAYPFYTNNNYISRWAGAPGNQSAQLAEGWIKRVVGALNPFDARVLDFHASPVNTVVSMIAQLGQRYEGAIAFNGDPCNLNSIGLIEAYDTVLRRGMMLSVDAGISYGPANAALMNAATRLSDFYMLLGNEAYQDAMDPTIGFGTGSGAYGTLAPSVFAFQNQVATLLDEELVLLRGRDDSAGPTRAKPVYNRFFWNFSQSDGEVAYVQAYNVSDQQTVDLNSDGCLDDTDGVIDEDDAKAMYPQGHGDAWGHYLTAVKYQYRLLQHANYVWEPRPESLLIAGVPVVVDYLDERKFARAAAQKARVGAEIVDLTYRKAYVDDPAGQWQGYKDTDRDRAWGLDDWARRAGQGAYFDWIVANGILPSVDPNTNHTGIAKIDRFGVTELKDIAAAYEDIQGQVDKADRGLNPLGVAKGAVPFDIDPSLLTGTNPKTHFEQVYTRALEAVKNAVTVFDYANQLTQRLRENQDSLDDFNKAIAEQERDYLNRLIEIFGYPYADDIGPGGTYPSGYEGPDWIHFMYVDPSELTGDEPIDSVQGYSVTYRFDAESSSDYALGLSAAELEVRYDFSSDGQWMVKPPEWTGARRAPGEIQMALSEVIVAKANLAKGMQEYDNILAGIEVDRERLELQYDLNAAEIAIRREQNDELTDLEEEIKFHKMNQLALKRTAETSDRIFEAIIEGIPKVAGIAASDVCAPARATLYGVRAGISIVLNIAADAEESAQLNDELAKNAVDRNADIEVMTTVGAKADLRERLMELENHMSDAGEKRMELSILKEQVEQAASRYLGAVARGQRLLQERAAWRKSIAPEIQESRYEDMAFRLFRNDALQKYRAQFDLAARYVYLAATAYDYETSLLGDDNGSGRLFLTDIIRQRSLGQLIGGLPVAGQPGLADPLARLGQNFAVYKTQMGFNNPQTETSRFSLRRELFRIKTNTVSDVSWRNTLEQYRVADLWQVPEFRRFCRPFAAETEGPQPGLVIPFTTYVQYGRNFFGWPLGGGDSTYDPTFFATKIRSVGVWFNNYDGQGLSFTPRVYLVPTGADIMRSPSDDTLQTRQWKVVDQKIPVPFPIGATDLDNPEWIPMNDTLSDVLADIRRFSRFRAYHDSGDFSVAETVSDSRLIGRSVWNTEWLLIIPGETLLNPAGEGLDTFIYGQPVPGGGGARDGNGVKDIKLFFQTYAYSGN